MANNENKINLGLKDLKNLKEQISEAKKEAEKDSKNAEKNNKPQSLGQKIFIVLVLILLVGGVVVGVIFSWDTMLLPKNSILIKINDQNNNEISGIKIKIIDKRGVSKEYENASNLTILNFKPGNYTLVFDYVPEGYSCSKTKHDFTLSEGQKLKLEYECERKK